MSSCEILGIVNNNFDLRFVSRYVIKFFIIRREYVFSQLDILNLMEKEIN